MNNMRTIRKRLNISLLKMSKDLKMNYGNLWNIENRGRSTAVDTAMAIATYLGSSVEEIFKK